MGSRLRAFFADLTGDFNTLTIVGRVVTATLEELEKSTRAK